MSLGETLLGISWNRAEYRQATDLLDRFPHNGLVTLPGDLVENHPPNRNLRIEPLTAQNRCGYRAGRLRTVDGNNHRGAEQLCQFGRTATAGGVHSVE